MRLSLSPATHRRQRERRCRRLPPTSVWWRAPYARPLPPIMFAVAAHAWRLLKTGITIHGVCGIDECFQCACSRFPQVIFGVSFSGVCGQDGHCAGRAPQADVAVGLRWWPHAMWWCGGLGACALLLWPRRVFGGARTAGGGGLPVLPLPCALATAEAP